MQNFYKENNYKKKLLFYLKQWSFPSVRTKRQNIARGKSFIQWWEKYADPSLINKTQVCDKKVIPPLFTSGRSYISWVIFYHLSCWHAERCDSRGSVSCRCLSPAAQPHALPAPERNSPGSRSSNSSGSLWEGWRSDPHQSRKKKKNLHPPSLVGCSGGVRASSSLPGSRQQAAEEPCALCVSARRSGGGRTDSVPSNRRDYNSAAFRRFNMPVGRTKVAGISALLASLLLGSCGTGGKGQRLLLLGALRGLRALRGFVGAHRHHFRGSMC